MRLGPRTRERGAAGLALLGFLVIIDRALATNGVEPIGVSSQSRARGGTDVAVGDSALSQIDNPASLALHRAPRFDTSLQLAFPDAEWTSPFGESESEVRVVPLSNVGVAWPVDDRLSLGIALHSKAGLASRYEMRHALIPWMKRRVGADSKMGGLLFNAAYKVTERLTLGAGARAEIASSEFSLVLGPADVEFGRGYAYGGGFQLGLHYQAADDLAFGLGYRSPSWFGDVAGGDAEASILGLPAIPLGSGRIDELRLPQKISAGVAWDATDSLKLVGEVRWLNYEQSSLDSLTIATDGVIDARLPLPLGYRDQWVFAAGAEYELDEHWTLGVGYNYGTTPVNSRNLLPMGSTLAQHHVTAGIRYRKDHWWVGVGYILALSPSLSGGGRSAVPLGVDYADSTLRQMQQSVVLGFGFSWGE